jgi:hypothetical protein
MLTIGQAIACSPLVKQLHAHHWSSNCMLTISQAIACSPLVKQLHAHQWSNNCMLTISQALVCPTNVCNLSLHIDKHNHASNSLCTIRYMSVLYNMWSHLHYQQTHPTFFPSHFFLTSSPSFFFQTSAHRFRDRNVKILSLKMAYDYFPLR